MSYCPKCEYEYPVSLTTCPDCGEELVEKIPSSFAPAVSPDDSWMMVGGVTSDMKAKVARRSLDANNIPSVLVPSNLVRLSRPAKVENTPSPGEGGPDFILVPKEFFDEAKLILSAVLGDELIRPVDSNRLI